jgi:L-2,4-diaminobutyrate decarboxylase
MFREADASMGAISMGGDYLSQPNVGIQGSRGAAAIPLFATLLAWGKSGLAKRIEHCLDQAALVADWVSAQPKLRLLCEPVSGVVVWKAKGGDTDTLHLLDRLQTGAASRLTLNGETWVRQVAANPLLNSQSVINAIEQALKEGL